MLHCGFGIGNDITAIKAVGRHLEKHTDSYVKSILSPKEREYYEKLPCIHKRIRFLAKCVSIKKALKKATRGELSDFSNITINSSKEYIDVTIENNPAFKESFCLDISMSMNGGYIFSTAIVVKRKF